MTRSGAPVPGALEWEVGSTLKRLATPSEHPLWPPPPRGWADVMGLTSGEGVATLSEVCIKSGHVFLFFFFRITRRSVGWLHAAYVRKDSGNSLWL